MKKPAKKSAAAKSAKKSAAKPAAKKAKPAAKAKAKPAKKPAAKKPAAKKPVAPAVEDIEVSAATDLDEATVAGAAHDADAEPAEREDGDDIVTDDPTFAPASLQKLEKGGYAIYFDIGAFDDKLDVQEAFSAIGEGNGYEWEAVLAPALEQRDPKAFAAVDWSPEADTFVASSTDKAPLAVLAAVLRDVVKDQASLEQAVKNHDPQRT